MTDERGRNLEVQSASGLGRYRQSVPLLLTGSYAALAQGFPFDSEGVRLLTTSLALGVLFLSPLPERRVVRTLLGVYAFLALVVAESVLSRSPSTVPISFRAAGWAAYALASGALPHFGPSAVSSEEPADPPSLNFAPLEPRKRTTRLPLAGLGLFAIGVAVLFLWPLPDVQPAKAVLFRSFAVVIGLALLGTVSELGAEWTMRPGRQPTLTYLRLGLCLTGLGLALMSASSWSSSRDFVALAWAAAATTVLALALRFRRFPRTKIEL